MKAQRLSTRTLAVMVVITSVIWTVSSDDKQKKVPCCEKVSMNKVTGPIIGYRLQKRNLPCVDAVILETENNILCISPRASWVRDKLRQFKKAQKDKPIVSEQSGI